MFVYINYIQYYINFMDVYIYTFVLLSLYDI